MKVGEKRRSVQDEIHKSTDDTLELRFLFIAFLIEAFCYSVSFKSAAAGARSMDPTSFQLGKSLGLERAKAK
jgi:hypothetical protein